jgi:hypothetical protein
MDPSLKTDIDAFVYEYLILSQHENVEIITGNSVKMKDIVKEIINDYWFDVQDGKGSNKGILIIGKRHFLF